jgi:hypothetical protein
MNESGFDPRQLDVEACMYLYPPVPMEVTCGQMTVIEAGQIPGPALIVTGTHFAPPVHRGVARGRLCRELGS